jgi:peroxiredoxin
MRNSITYQDRVEFMKHFVTFLASLLFSCAVLTAGDSMTSHPMMKSMPFVTLPKEPHLLLPKTLSIGSQGIDVLALSKHHPIIFIRFLGTQCIHCAEQLYNLNKQTEILRRNGIRVIAVSSEKQKDLDIFAKKNSFSEVFTFVEDTNNEGAASLSAFNKEKDIDLHVAMIVHKSTLVFATYGDEPFMDIEKLIEKSLNEVRYYSQKKNQATDRLLSNDKFTITTIASYPDIINPVDLSFNSAIFHPNELWVVTGTNQAGEGIAIIRNTGKNNQTIEKRRDYAASHFMWRTMAIDFGDNGTFGTAQSGEPKQNTVPQMDFMGPTLWASDTAIFARRNQGPFDQVKQRLASHLDMLHQSPFTMGIAHEKNNVYWVNDNMYNDICRYDFANPHEIGGTDHRDGSVRRFSQIKLTKREHNLPSHLVLDKSSSWLYYIDGNSIYRLQTQSGTIAKKLTVQSPRDERLAEFVEMKDALYEPYITEGLNKPVGIDIYYSLMAVSDRENGKIYLYRLHESQKPTFIESIETGAKGIAGIEFDADGDIYFVDQIESTVKKVTFNQKIHCFTNQSFYTIDEIQKADITIVNGTNESIEPALRLAPNSSIPDGWEVILPNEEYSIGNNQQTVLPLEITTHKKSGIARFVIQCYDRKTQNIYKTLSFTFASINLKKIIIEDATRENYSLMEDIAKTQKRYYQSMTSEEFLRWYDETSNPETVIWNCGTHGFMNDIHAAIMQDMQKKGIEVLLIGDDPISLYTLEGKGNDLLKLFGAKIKEVPQSAKGDDGKRIWQGVQSNSTFGNLQNIAVQLPQLNHYLGLEVIPVPTLQLAARDAATIITDKKNTTIIHGIQREYGSTRNAYFAFNLSSINDTTIRYALVNNAVSWLEQFTTSVQENYIALNDDIVVIPTQQSIVVKKQQTESLIERCIMYNIQGTTVYEYSSPYRGENEITIPVQQKISGTYFIVVFGKSGMNVKKIQL